MNDIRVPAEDAGSAKGKDEGKMQRKNRKVGCECENRN